MIDGSIFIFNFQNEKRLIWSDNEQKAIEAFKTRHIAEKASRNRSGTFIRVDDELSGMDWDPPINLGSDFEKDHNGMAVFNSHYHPGIAIPLVKDRPENLTKKLELDARFQELKQRKQ